jgi:hypothetical protein
MRSLILVLCLSWLLSGCGLLGGLRAEAVAVSAQKPSNVAVYAAIQHGGKPVTGLTESSFQVYEDGQAIEPGITQQTLLPTDVAAAHHALLLVDMSGDLSPDERERLAEATGRFVTRVRKTQPVSVHAFDGSPRIRQVASYSRSTQEVASVGGLATYVPSDRSSNLNSAVVESLATLDARLMSRAKPIRIGTLVVLARGPDLAGRVPPGEMEDAVDETSHHVMVVYLEGPDAPHRALDKDGSFSASTLSSLGLALDDAGRAAADLVGQYYLFSYCSPARADVRSLRLEVRAHDAEGKEIQGSIQTEFDATGFTTGCNPNSPPRFVVPKVKPSDEPTDQTSSTVAPRKKSAPAGESSTPPSEEIVPPPDKPGYAK